MPFRRLITAVLLAVTPAFASAQFTTFIPPKNKVADSVKAAVVAQQKAQADTAASARLTNMKTWVDSAAGVLPRSATPATLVSPADSLARGVVATDTATFRSGAPAPATASALPLIVLFGAASVGTGLWLVLGARARRDGA